MFLAPIKKSKAYVSEIRTKQGRPFLLKISNVHIQDIFHLKEHQGHILQVGVPTDAIAFDTIRTLDEQALQETLLRKAKWFPRGNELTRDKVHEYFRPSISSYPANSISVLVSVSKEPSEVTWFGENVNCIDRVINKGKRAIKEANATLTIEACGIYFYEQKFGIRWILRSVAFHGPPSVELVDINKSEIESFWKEDVVDVAECMERDIERLHEKIEALKVERQVMEGILAEACKMDEMSPMWNARLEELRQRVARYRSGAM